MSRVASRRFARPLVSVHAELRIEHREKNGPWPLSEKSEDAGGEGGAGCRASVWSARG
jgi:hypothetical protein